MFPDCPGTPLHHPPFQFSIGDMHNPKPNHASNSQEPRTAFIGGPEPSFGGQSTSSNPLVSIVIPSMNSADTIEKTLQSVRQQTYARIEIIVVDGQSLDHTPAIAEKLGAQVYSLPPSRSAQVNFGVSKSSGKYVYRVDSDFVLDRNVITQAVAQSERLHLDGVMIHNVSSPRASFWSRVRKAERNCYRDDSLNVAVRFFTRESFEILGGFREDLIAAEDYEFHSRFVRNKFKLGRIEATELHLGEPVTLADVVRKHIYYGKTLPRYFRLDTRLALRQFSPVRHAHVRHIGEIAHDPRILVGFTVYQSVRYFATAIGMLISYL